MPPLNLLYSCVTAVSHLVVDMCATSVLYSCRAQEPRPPATVNISYGGLVTKVEMGVFQTESELIQSDPDISFGPE